MPNTINNAIPFVPENTIDPAAGLNLALNTVDALLQLLVLSVGTNAPPGSPANGARYIVGTSPTGAWAGQANKLARWLDGAWQFTDARYALNSADGLFYVRAASTWTSAPLPANVQALAGLTGAADRVPYFTGEGAMALAVLTAQARTFLAAVDAAGQRSAMGLGSAATATVQASVVDTTSGRLMLVGAAGMLTQTPPNPGDCNLVSHNGLYAITSSTLNAPLPGIFGSLLMTGRVSSEQSQLCFVNTGATINSPRLALRNRYASTAGVWGNWAELYHTANLTPNLLTSFTLATLPAAAANARLQVYVSNLAGQAAPVYSDGTNWRRVSDNTIAN